MLCIIAEVKSVITVLHRYMPWNKIIRHGMPLIITSFTFCNKHN